ncbi:MAG: hypothetical protein EHM24_04010 [Acidobacteria bacterium]|nr:MAG: hypothetical protein EHM24_04010 [Acidobacteriota bacterium]
MISRKKFLCRSVAGVAGCCAALGHSLSVDAGQAVSPPPATADRDKEFIQNWLADLMEAIDREPDESVKARLVGACGRACFERHEFKRNWAVQGRGDADKLIAALQANFEVWREGGRVHVRYGAVSKGCYCPAARYRPARPGDIHCYCSRASHQAVWETALGHPVRVDLVESVRRGGKTCHFVVHVAA